MISVASLLNPATSGLRSTLRSSNSPSPYDGRPPVRFGIDKQKMVKDAAVFAKGKVKGEVNFPPFEALDEASIQEMKKYQVHPLRHIMGYPRHIPYNSDKKTFLDKTGRESFEVFQYEFRVPGDEKIYTVMWDYNIGLVRITPFFKCCKYSKTTPAKMLSMNPGLREICHSITGGALAAQGYWMPYSCALAVCATFCAHISGALIPIFGPTFPSRCIATNHPSYGTMTIEGCIIAAAKAQADAFREDHIKPLRNFKTVKGEDETQQGLLRDVQNLALDTTVQPDRRTRLKRGLTASSMYSSDAEASDTSISSRNAHYRRYTCSPITPASSNASVYRVVETPRQLKRNVRQVGHRTALPTYSNKPLQRYGLGLRSRRPSNEANPILSAIPRSIASRATATTLSTRSPGMAPPYWGWKSQNRPPIMQVDTDEGYDGEESASASDHSVLSEEIGDLEKRAALLLMQLSDRDGQWSASLASAGAGAPVDATACITAQAGISTPLTPAPVADTSSSRIYLAPSPINLKNRAKDESTMDIDPPQTPESSQRKFHSESQVDAQGEDQDGPRVKRRRAFEE